MKRELLVPLILIVGVSMLVMPAAAQELEALPFSMESNGYGKIKVDEKWGFWPIYCRGCADFSYYTCVCGMCTDIYLNVYGKDCSAWASWWCVCFEGLDMQGCGRLFTFEIPYGPDCTTNFDVGIGGARVVLFVGSEIPDPYSICPCTGLCDEDACGIVIVYGCGYFYMGRIGYINWNVMPRLGQD